MHDRASEAAGEKVRCPIHLVWGERGVVGRLFDPVADWPEKCVAPVTGRALPAGHFIAEEVPDLLLEELGHWLS